MALPPMFCEAEKNCIKGLFTLNLLTLQTETQECTSITALDLKLMFLYYLHCCCSVAKSCPTLWDPMSCSTPGFPGLHYLPEFAQTHVHWADDAIQPPHPLSPSSPFALNLSQHQGLLQWASPLHQVAKYWSFSFSTSPSNEYLRLISFRIDWFLLIFYFQNISFIINYRLPKKHR